MSDGRSVFDAAAGQACINEVNSLACDAHGSFACGMMIHGTVGLNGACYGDRECQSDLICDTTSTCPGLCRTPTPDGQTSNGVPCALSSSLYGTVCLGPTPIGQSCAPTGTVTRDRLCTLGAFCSAAKVCTAQPLANEGCTPGDYYECAGSLHCSGGVCAPLGAVSAPCDSTRFCKSDLYCSATNVCTPPGPVGTACSAVAWQCQPRLFCEMLAGSPTGTCQAPHTIGQSCTWRGYQCGELGGGSSLYCTATSSTPGVCALKKSADAACQGSSECQSQTCTNSVCVPYPGVCVDPTP